MRLELHWIDYLIMVIYFLFVLGIGWFLRKYMKNANAFLEAAVNACLGCWSCIYLN